MLTSLRVTRFVYAVIGLASLAAFGPARADGFDLNHYILGCAKTCASILDPAAVGNIDATFTGSWYDPAQSGQGLSLEVLPDNRILVFWFTFDPDGTQQVWLVGTGTYNGKVATVDSVNMPTGGRWIPNFDPTTIVDKPWGTITLTFDDADHGRVEFNSVLDYGIGNMNLVRLTQPAGITGSGASPTGEAWMQTSAMNTPRMGHSATVLADGTVLVVGGIEHNSGPTIVLATTESFDPHAAHWIPAGSLNEPRTLHSATRLADGRVLITGGVGSEGRSYLSTSELYDPSTGIWSKTGDLNNVSRAGHTGTLLKSGKVLVVGGHFVPDPNHYLRAAGDTEIYDPATGVWTVTGTMHVGRMYEHSATLLQDGRVLVVGGSTNFDDETTNGAELFDPLTGAWSVTAPCPECGMSHAATLLPNGKVLVAGGLVIPKSGDTSFISDTSAIYDPATGTWGDVRKMARASVGDAATVLANGDVLVAGSSGSQRYDSVNSRWIDGGRLNTPRLNPTKTFLSDGRVLVAGGYVYTSMQDGSIDVYGSAEIYGPMSATYSGRNTGTWYDPTQSGHGLVLEALPGDQLLATWFAFDPAGKQQAWFLGVGTFSGNTATIASVVQPTGGRFIPNFDPSKIVNSAWGSFKLTFTDCDHGKVDFASTSGYGSGSMNLTRLTQPAGLSCP